MASRIAKQSAAVGNNRRLVEKVTARVFCQLEGKGGNPVTIFAPQNKLSTRQREELATGCDWESVFVESQTMSFYLPSGEQVSFCAHAAMGGSTVLREASDRKGSKKEERLEFQAAPVSGDENTTRSYHSIVHEDDIVSLEMKVACWMQGPVEHPPTLHRILRDFHGIKQTDLSSSKPGYYDSHFPTFCNSSIARNKTLVYVNSMDALNNAKPPPASSADAYRRACDAIGSTGLYLYTKHPKDDNSWECRQFPRASGYPEDPATGIAAAALAVSLHAGPRQFPLYRFHQGTAMGKASLILVENIKLSVDDETAKDETTEGDEDDDDDDERPKKRQSQRGSVSFKLLGRVEVDNREMIEVDDAEN